MKGKEPAILRNEPLYASLHPSALMEQVDTPQFVESAFTKKVDQSPTLSVPEAAKFKVGSVREEL